MGHGGSSADRGEEAGPLSGVDGLVHGLDAVVWELDPAADRFTFVSRSAESLLGHPAERWLDEPGFRLRVVHPEDRERVEEASRLGIEQGRDHRLEYRAVTGDGRVVWLRDAVRVVDDGRGGTRLRGVTVDVTAAREDRERLSLEKDFYQRVLDHIDTDFAVFDVEGRFQYINPSSIRDPEVRRWALGRTNVDYCRGRDRPLEIGERRHELIRAAVREGTTVEVEETMPTPQGGERVILRRHFPIRDGAGRVVNVVGQGYDITERKAAEEALRASEERFRLMVEGSEEVFFYEHDREHRFRYLSPSVEHVLGYRPEELLGRAYDDLLTGVSSDLAVHQRTEDTLRSGDRSGAYPAVVRRRDGAAAVLEIVERPVIRAGEVAGIQGFARDVTERKRAEAELRLEREKQEALLDAIPDIVWMKDEDSRYLTVNEAFARAVGRPREEIIGTTDPDLFPPDVARTFRRSDGDVMETGRQARTDETVVHADGSERVVETVRVPFKDEEGSVVGTAGIARDVTDRKRAEVALRESEARLRALVENVSDAIAVVEANGTIRYVSPAYERITGWSSEERSGRPAGEDLHPDDAAAAKRAWRELLDAPGTPVSLEARLRRRDGTWRMVEVTAKNLLDDPVVRGAVVTYHDVTERRSLEEQLRGAQKMEAVGRLAGGIAHDFNNVLTAIRGHAQFVLEDAPDAASGLRADLEEIIRSADRAHDLTRQLLAFSRRQPSERRVLCPEEVIRGAEKMIRRLIGEDVELEVCLPDDPGRIKADPTQMEQVLVNLAINARDAMPSGGRLRIAVDDVEIGEGDLPGIPTSVTPGPYVRMTIADTGTGMDAPTRERIFEPFFTTKPVGAGTGLGLATVYGIVKQAQGYISVSSEPGRGTVFEIFLPRTREEVPDRGAWTSANGDSEGSETVLLVEDQPGVRALARRVLQRAGYRVVEAAEGREALERWEEVGDAVDLLLTDVVMPRMGGKELSRRLRALRPELEVLYMSGYAEEQIAHRGIVEPEANLLQKPFTPEGLLAHVRSTLDRALRP